MVLVIFFYNGFVLFILVFGRIIFKGICKILVLWMFGILKVFVVNIVRLGEGKIKR